MTSEQVAKVRASIEKSGGAHRYDVTIRLDDGRSETVRDIPADDEWKARTRATCLMTMTVRGQFMEFDVNPSSAQR